MSTLQKTAAGKIAEAQGALLKNEKAKELLGNKTVRQQEKEKYEKMVLELSESAPPALVTVIRYLAPLISWTVVALEIIVPVLYQLSRIISAFVAVLPLDIMYIIFGFLICFFGGSYPTTIAAAEAWRQAGGKEAVMHFKDLLGEVQHVIKASEEDDKKDDDHDGIADVNQISSKELVLRKMNIAVTAMDPNKVNGAMQGIYSGWIGVVAVLKVEFAKTM